MFPPVHTHTIQQWSHMPIAPLCAHSDHIVPNAGAGYRAGAGAGASAGDCHIDDDDDDDDGC